MERLPGFRDFYPEPLPQPDLWSADARQYIFSKWRTVARRYGFREYDGPPLEPLELFTTKSGQEIVGQLYNFTDKGERAVALRPEMTPTLARMIAAHERSYKKPIKWFALPQLFRYERQQKGRLREHFQFNADIIGESSVAADAELIRLLIDALRAFDLTSSDFVIRISSREVWRQRLDSLRIEQAAIQDAIFQAIDKMEREPLEATRTKLLGLSLSEDQISKIIGTTQITESDPEQFGNLAYMGELFGYLEDVKEFCKADFRIVRGLAYYTGLVFEAHDRKGEFRAIAGGGRYDNLVRLISGGKVNLPALGFGMGDVVLLELLKARGLLPAFYAGLDAFCLIEDEALRAESLKLVQELRTAGLVVDYPLAPAKSDKQFKRAQELKAAHTFKLERNQSGCLMTKVKNLKTRAEKTLTPAAASDELLQNSSPKSNSDP